MVESAPPRIRGSVPVDCCTPFDSRQSFPVRRLAVSCAARRAHDLMLQCKRMRPDRARRRTRRHIGATVPRGPSGLHIRAHPRAAWNAASTPMPGTTASSSPQNTSGSDSRCHGGMPASRNSRLQRPARAIAREPDALAAGAESNRDAGRTQRRARDPVARTRCEFERAVRQRQQWLAAPFDGEGGDGLRVHDDAPAMEAELAPRRGQA